MVFLNRGDHFEARAMPVEAQYAPCFGVNVADMDGDGAEDVFVSQNFFGVDLETSRYDGGRGLWMKGDGKGGLRSLSGEESGVKMYGEGRGSAVGDYDGDGRVDLVVGQNGVETKLYRNVGGKVGLRVRLAGGSGNASGIGAVVRVKWGGKQGPARGVHGGSGYWSQDSVVEVMGSGGEVSGVEVRWAGGRTTSGAVPPGAREIEVNVNGQIKQIR